MDDDQLQQVMEDLANDFLCYRSTFDSTSDPPRRRRRRQSPERAWATPSRVANYNSLDSPLVRSPRGPRVIAHSAKKPHTHALAALSPQDGGARKHPIVQGIGCKRTSKGGSPNSYKGGSPQTPSAFSPNPTTSPNHDSLRSPFSRKFLWTHQSRPDSPLAHAPRHRHVCADCASRAHSNGKVHRAVADTSQHVIPRSYSEPLPEQAKPLLHWAKRPDPVRVHSRRELPVGLAQAPPSLRNNRHVAQRHLKAVAHALVATISMAAPRNVPRGVTDEDLTMLAWEHTERLALGRRRSAEAASLGAVVRSVAPPAQRLDAFLRGNTSDALLRGSTSRALSLIRERGLDIKNTAEI